MTAITPANSTIKVKQVRTKLNEVIGRVNTLSNTSLTVSEINGSNTITNAFANVSAIRFDKDTGFSVSSWGPGTVKVSLGSTFKTWNVDGQPSLVAVGEDTVKFVGSGLNITTSNVAGNKTITFTPNFAPYLQVANANITFNTKATWSALTSTNTALRLYVANQISGLVNSAPAMLDTLRELANAMANDANFATTINNSLATKLSNNITTTVRVRNIIPETTNTYSLGSPSRRFKSLYVSSNTVYIGPVALGVSANGTFQVTQANNVTQTIVTASKENGKTKITDLVLQTVLGTKYGGTGLSSLTPNGVMFGANSSVIGFITGTSGTVMQISPNGTPAFDDLDGGSF